MAITLADMESKLLTVEGITNKLQKTEPLTTSVLDGTQRVRFNFDPDWNHGLKTLSGTDVVQVQMSIDGTDHQMTKEAALQAAASFGLPSSYLTKIPAKYASALMNYHFTTLGEGSAQKVLSVNDVVSAFTRPTLVPFSNLQLAEKVIEGIQTTHGKTADIFADYKFANSLQRTDIRFIVPAGQRVITNGGMDDVPEGEDDAWMTGIHLSNSLIGKTQTALEAYLFRWWCTNGATTTMDAGGLWSRRVNGQQEDVYEWARQSVDEVLGGMEGMFDQIQALTQLGVTGTVVDVLKEIFKQYEVPISQQATIQRHLLSLPTISMYSVMQAITEAANDADLDDRRRDRLMRIGGALPTRTFDTLKARVWREGHTAKLDQRNPYEPLVLVD